MPLARGSRGQSFTAGKSWPQELGAAPHVSSLSGSRDTEEYKCSICSLLSSRSTTPSYGMEPLTLKGHLLTSMNLISITLHRHGQRLVSLVILTRSHRVESVNHLRQS